MENTVSLTKEISIFEFAKLSNVEKTLYMFRFNAAILDSFTENDLAVIIYSCSNFFVEIRMDAKSSFYEIIPFKRGFEKTKNTAASQKNNALEYENAA